MPNAALGDLEMTMDPKNVKGEIALELDAERVSASDFETAVDSFISLVREVTRQVNDSLPLDSWFVRVQEGSQVLSLAPNPLKLTESVSRQVVGNIMDGIAALEDSANTPRNFSERALKRTRSISKLSVTDANRDLPIRLLTRQRSCSVSRRTYDNVSKLLDVKYEDEGSVDGTLEVVSAHNGYEFRVYDPVWSRAIRCTFSEELLPSALAAFKKRVEVTGQIKYTQDGFPISVKVARFDIFPEGDELPGRKDVRGIFEQINGA